MPDYITAADERRAAAWTLRMVHSDLTGARLVAEDGPIHPLAVFRACSMAEPGLWLDPDTAAARLEAHALDLFASEQGLMDGCPDER